MQIKEPGELPGFLPDSQGWRWFQTILKFLVCTHMKRPGRY